eukprot:363171-Chlamydomonas_euryale.AAC.3
MSHAPTTGGAHLYQGHLTAHAVRGGEVHAAGGHRRRLKALLDVREQVRTHHAASRVASISDRLVTSASFDEKPCSCRCCTACCSALSGGSSDTHGAKSDGSGTTSCAPASSCGRSPPWHTSWLELMLDSCGDECVKGKDGSCSSDAETPPLPQLPPLKRPLLPLMPLPWLRRADAARGALTC